MKSLFLSLIFPVFCSASDYVWKSDCDRDMRSMKNCSGEMFNFYDSELNRLYSIQMAHLKTEYRKEYLRAAQKAWVIFRDKDCMYYAGKREDSGSIWSLSHSSCLAERTKMRVKELNSYVQCRDNGCPY